MNQYSQPTPRGLPRQTMDAPSSNPRASSGPGLIADIMVSKTATNIDTHPEAFSSSRRFLTSAADRFAVPSKQIRSILSENFKPSGPNQFLKGSTGRTPQTLYEVGTTVARDVNANLFVLQSEMGDAAESSVFDRTSNLVVRGSEQVTLALRVFNAGYHLNDQPQLALETAPWTRLLIKPPNGEFGLVTDLTFEEGPYTESKTPPPYNIKNTTLFSDYMTDLAWRAPGAELMRSLLEGVPGYKKQCTYTGEWRNRGNKDTGQAAAWLARVGGTKDSKWSHLPLNRKTNVGTRTVIRSHGVPFTVNYAMTRIRLDAIPDGTHVCVASHVPLGHPSSQETQNRGRPREPDLHGGAGTVTGSNASIGRKRRSEPVDVPARRARGPGVPPPGFIIEEEEVCPKSRFGPLPTGQRSYGAPAPTSHRRPESTQRAPLSRRSPLSQLPYNMGSDGRSEVGGMSSYSGSQANQMLGGEYADLINHGDPISQAPSGWSDVPHDQFTVPLDRFGYQRSPGDQTQFAHNSHYDQLGYLGSQQSVPGASQPGIQQLPSYRRPNTDQFHQTPLAQSSQDPQGSERSGDQNQESSGPWSFYEEPIGDNGQIDWSRYSNERR